jgi:hypothetical protein
MFAQGGGFSFATAATVIGGQSVSSAAPAQLAPPSFLKDMLAYPEFQSSLKPAPDISDNDEHFEMLATPNSVGHHHMLHVSGCKSNPHANGVYLSSSGTSLHFRHQNEASSCRIELLASPTQDQGRLHMGFLVHDQARVPIRFLSHSPSASATPAPPANAASSPPLHLSSLDGCEPALPSQPISPLAPPASVSARDVKNELFSYKGSTKDGKRDGSGVCEYHQPGNRDQYPGLDYTWNKGDKYEGGWKEDRRHGACTYTFHTSERFQCTWNEGKCPEFATKQSQVLAKAKADAQAALSIFGASAAAAPLPVPAQIGGRSPSTVATGGLFGGLGGIVSPAAGLFGAPASSSVAASVPTASGSSSIFGAPVAFSFTNAPINPLFSFTSAPINPLSVPAASPSAAPVDTASSQSIVGGTTIQDCHPPPAEAAFSLTSDAMLVQAVPTALRVAFDDVLTSRVLSVSITGATGPDSSAINGVYRYMAQPKAESVSQHAASSAPTLPDVASRGKRSSGRKPNTNKSSECAVSMSALRKASGDVVLEYRESSHILAICRAANAGAGVVLMYCNVPLHLPIYSSIPLLLCACSSETWFLGSNGHSQPHVIVSLPSSPISTIFRATPTFFGGLPVYASSNPERSSIQYNVHGGHWEMRSSQSGRVVAVSAAHSIGFPAPMCWLELCEQGDAETSLADVTSTDSAALCILVSGSNIPDVNGVYFTSLSPDASSMFAHMLGGLCSIQNAELEGRLQWVVHHPDQGYLYVFKGVSSPFIKYPAVQGTWVSVRAPASPPILSVPLPLKWSDFAAETDFPHDSADPSSRLALPPISNTLAATFASTSDWKFFFNVPLSMTVTHIANTALADAALYAGEYQLVDVMGSVLNARSLSPGLQQKSGIHMYFRHSLCGNVLHTELSPDLILVSACIYEESSIGPNVFASKPSSKFGLCLEHSMKLTFEDSGINFNVSLLGQSSQPTPVLNVRSCFKPSTQSKHHHVVNPNFNPTMSDLSHVSFIAGLLTDDNADACQFWDKKLISLCGSGVFADTAFVSDLLEFSKSLTANKSIHHSTAAIRHSRAFQAFIKLRILSPLMPAVSAYLDFCTRQFGEWNEGKMLYFDQNWIERECKLSLFVTSEIAAFVESLCSNGEFQCFLIASVLELYAASCKSHSQILIPAVTSIVAAVFKVKSILKTSNQFDCVKLRACIIGLHDDFGPFNTPNVKLLCAQISRVAPSPRDVLRTLCSLLAVTSTVHPQSLFGMVLRAELFQLLLLCDDSIKQLLQVSPSSISLYREAVCDSEAVCKLKLKKICLALSDILASLSKFHNEVNFGFHLPSSWRIVTNKGNTRPYYLNTMSNAMLLHCPRPSLKSLESSVSSMAAFISIALFETPGSTCSVTETSDSVAECFASNQDFALYVSDAFTRIQAFHFLHQLPASPMHPVRRDVQLCLSNQAASEDSGAGVFDVSFGSTRASRKTLCSKCLKFCSSVRYEVKSDTDSKTSAAALSDSDLALMDEMFALAQKPVVHPRPPAPQSGHGEFIFINDARYVGQFQAGKMDGNGSLLFVDGAMYHGMFKDGLMHGQGVMIYGDGTKYEGMFSKGKRDGKGKLISGTSGSIHVGNFHQDQRHGEGHFESLCDFRIQDSMMFAGDKFKGIYSNDKKDGVGTTTFFNGEILTCNWSGGKSQEHDDFQGKVVSKSGNKFCLSCVLNGQQTTQTLGDVGPTVAAVFQHERPLFQSCINESLQRNFRCKVFSDRLGVPSHFTHSNSGCVLQCLFV